MPLYYRYFRQPYTGNYFDYTIDIAPLNDFENDDSEGYEVDTSEARQGFDEINSTIAFGFANIPTGNLMVIDQDNQEGVTYLKKFPTGEFSDWLNDREYVPTYDEDTGLVGSSTEDMLKTFILDPSIPEQDLMEDIDFVTLFTGVNSRLYDQDNNFVFSYSDRMQGPVSIHGNVFKHYQNYSINSIPVNTQMSRGCSDKFQVSGLFFTHPDFKFTASVRGHTCPTEWTPEKIENKIWLSESGLFPARTGDFLGYHAQWIPDVSSGVYEEEAEGVFDLVSGNRLDNFSATPLMYNDKITQDIQYFTKDYACNDTSYLSSNDLSKTTFWRSENISFPLDQNLNRAANIGIVFVLRLNEDFKRYQQLFSDGLELMYFGETGITNQLSINVDKMGTEYYFRLKFKGNDQPYHCSPAISEGDYDFHILQWTYDLSSETVYGFMDAISKGNDDLSRGGEFFPENTNMILQKHQGIEIAEVLIYPQTLQGGFNYDIDKIYFIDGYLSHKWNLNVLPLNHPFYHGYPAVLKAGMKGGPLEDLFEAKVSNLTHF